MGLEAAIILKKRNSLLVENFFVDDEKELKKKTEAVLDKLFLSYKSVSR